MPDRLSLDSRLARVAGRVQGVGFRAWTRGEAEALGLAGWVRNQADGTVALRVQGAPEAVAALLVRLRQGPPGARVTDLAEEPCPPEPGLAGFRILR